MLMIARKSFFTVCAVLIAGVVVFFSPRAQAQDTSAATNEAAGVNSADDTSPELKNKKGAHWNVPLSASEKTEIKKLREQLKAKKTALHAAFSSESFDEVGARALESDIQALITQIAQKRFEAIVAYKKANPSWKPDARKPSKRKGKPQGKAVSSNVE